MSPILKRMDRIGIALLITAVTAAGCEDNASKSGRAQVREAPKALHMTIPAGTRVVAALGTHLSSDTNHAGDPFVATTTEAIVIDGKTVAPAGTKIRGGLRDVQASGRVKGRARMTLAYEEIVDAAGNAHTISAQPLTLQAASDTHGDVEKIAAGGILGAVIGGIAGGGKGAAIGAGAGAGAGTVLMLATKGDDVELNPGQKLYVHMTSATSIPVVAQR
jgi:hypothetical protein